MTSKDYQVQVVIVGAGPAGSVTAAALAEQGLDVLLVDRASFPREKTCGDGLTPRSVAVLRELNLVSELEAAGALRIEAARIYAPNGRAIQVGFDELEGDLPSFGLTLPRIKLDEILLARAQAAGVRLVTRLTVRDLIWENGSIGGVQGLVDGRPVVVRAPLTCLATGAAMPLVIKAGLLASPPPVMRAARAYHEELASLDLVFQLYFDRRLLPGYGWIFPLANNQANVGAGCFPAGQFRNQTLAPQRLYERFVTGNLEVRRQLGGGRETGDAKAYPLRSDFVGMRTETDGLLVVGEAAGLVNPINGEGVDYALESGLMAAEAILAAVARDDYSAASLAVYGQNLRQRYHSFFYYLTRMRAWYIRERVINLIVKKAQKRESLRLIFVKAALGLMDPKEAVSWRTLREIVF